LFKSKNITELLHGLRTLITTLVASVTMLAVDRSNVHAAYTIHN